jgi:hypothetical protein
MEHPSQLFVRHQDASRLDVEEGMGPPMLVELHVRLVGDDVTLLLVHERVGASGIRRRRHPNLGKSGRAADGIPVEDVGGGIILSPRLPRPRGRGRIGRRRRRRFAAALVGEHRGYGAEDPPRRRRRVLPGRRLLSLLLLLLIAGGRRRLATDGGALPGHEARAELAPVLPHHVLPRLLHPRAIVVPGGKAEEGGRCLRGMTPR